jgi:isopentenyldiphosphate isomerase
MKEIIDIFDEHMNHIGTMERHMAHKTHAWHKNVNIWVTDGKRVLVQRRSATKRTFPNCWDASAAGHFSAGETPITGAKREFREELGLKWTFGELKENCIFKYAEFDTNEFCYMYFIRANVDISRARVQKSEVSEVKYMPFDEFVAGFNSGTEFIAHCDGYRECVINGLKKLLV